MPLERFAAAWREAYILEATDRERRGDDGACVFCALALAAPSSESGVLAQSAECFVCLNAFPYGSGHLLVLPRAHVASLDELSVAAAHDLFDLVRDAARALTVAYQPDGLNIGFNLGRAAGAGIPGHLHGHVLPRWNGDTNFMTAIGETRVLPESLASSWEKIAAAWPRTTP